MPKKGIFKITHFFKRKTKKDKLPTLKIRTKYRKNKILIENWFRTTKKRLSKSFLLIPLSIFAGLFLFVIALTLIISPTNYNKNFIDGILIESHGLLLEILFISIILYAFQKNMEKKATIRKYREEIQLSGEFTSEEMKSKIRANITKLNELGDTNIDLSNFDLSETYLERVDLRGAMLQRTSFKDSSLDDSLLQGANLTAAILNGASFCKTKFQRANFTGASLEKAVFSYSEFQNALFVGAKLKKCEFINSDLQKVDFLGANLDGALLIECKLLNSSNLTLKQLLKTSSLFKTELDEEIMIQVKKNRKELLAPPKFSKKEDKT